MKWSKYKALNVLMATIASFIMFILARTKKVEIEKRTIIGTLEEFERDGPLYISLNEFDKEFIISEFTSFDEHQFLFDINLQDTLILTVNKDTDLGKHNTTIYNLRKGKKEYINQDIRLKKRKKQYYGFMALGFFFFLGIFYSYFYSD